jgi:hypothetical protein
MKRFVYCLALKIQVYGACVANITGGVSRSACEAEFTKLKQCFTRVAKNAASRR